MRFSTKAGYGLRAMVNLASNYPHQKSVHEISRDEGISLKYLERLLGILKKNNLVKSQRGRVGGYILAKNPAKIRVGEIIEVLEGPIVPMACSQGVCRNKCDCSSSVVWTKLQTQIKKTLYSIKLSELI
jgi:Rrf2 family protein